MIKSEYELLEKRSKIIGFMLAKNYWPLHMKTEYLENCPPNTHDIINTLRDWIDEANIPNCYDIPRGLSIYSVNQIASINRDLDFGVNILSKKGIRKELAINDEYMSEICSILRLTKSIRKATENKTRVILNYYPLL